MFYPTFYTYIKKTIVGNDYNKYDTEKQQAIDYFTNNPKLQDIYIIDFDTGDCNGTYLQIQGQSGDK